MWLLITYKWITQHATFKLADFTDPKGLEMPTVVESLHAGHLQTELYLEKQHLTLLNIFKRS